MEPLCQDLAVDLLRMTSRQVDLWCDPGTPSGMGSTAPSLFLLGWGGGAPWPRRVACRPPQRGARTTRGHLGFWACRHQATPTGQRSCQTTYFFFSHPPIDGRCVLCSILEIHYPILAATAYITLISSISSTKTLASDELVPPPNHHRQVCASNCSRSPGSPAPFQSHLLPATQISRSDLV